MQILQHGDTGGMACGIGTADLSAFVTDLIEIEAVIRV